MKRFPSVRKNSEFQRVYKHGKSLANAFLVMYVAENGLEYNRLGVSCSKKIGNSVVRHTMARKLREIFRLNKQASVTGSDIILVVRKRAAYATYQELEKAYLELCGRHHKKSELKRKVPESTES